MRGSGGGRARRYSPSHQSCTHRLPRCTHRAGLCGRRTVVGSAGGRGAAVDDVKPRPGMPIYTHPPITPSQSEAAALDAVPCGAGLIGRRTTGEGSDGLCQAPAAPAPASRYQCRGGGKSCSRQPPCVKLRIGRACRPTASAAERSPDPAHPAKTGDDLRDAAEALVLDCLASADAAHAEQRSKHEASAKAEWEQERVLRRLCLNSVRESGQRL